MRITSETHSFIKLIFVVIALTFVSCSQKQEVVNVGVLHSLSGTMAISEVPVVNATILAINEINANGGVLGKKINPIIVDGKSNDVVFQNQSKDLIVNKKVDIIFGCWTSSSRKRVIPIIEKNKKLLFYPVQFEGIESSKNVFYLGQSPSQQVMPSILWSYKNIGKKFFLASSDYVYPRVTNKLIKDHLKSLGAELVGEHYIPLGEDNLSNLVSKISKVKPDIIINTINGDSNLYFYKELFDKKIKTPSLSFSLSEVETMFLNSKHVEGHYFAQSYFNEIKNKQNIEFSKNYRKKHGKHARINAAMVLAYTGVYLWAQAVTKAKSFSPLLLKQELKGESIKSPLGQVMFDRQNNYLWQPSYIGRANSEGQLEIISGNSRNIKARVFPMYHTKIYWHNYLSELYSEWDGSWSAPTKSGGNIENQK
jgi:urea transport system substrate-binding protein